jgi:hypothetical protein
VEKGFSFLYGKMKNCLVSHDRFSKGISKQLLCEKNIKFNVWGDEEDDGNNKVGLVL